MSTKQFNTIYEFTEFITEILKHHDYEFNEFRKCIEVSNLEHYFIIYRSAYTNMLHCMTLCGSLSECLSVFDQDDDQIICTIDRDLKIENYRIKKA